MKNKRKPIEQKLKDVFNSFAGAQVDTRLGLKDPVLVSLAALARVNGLDMFVFTPGLTQPMITSPRVEVHLGRAHQYKAKIQGLAFIA